MVDTSARDLIQPTGAKRIDLCSQLWRGPSVQEVLDQNGGSFPGFDTFRVGLSLSVVLVHSCILSYGIAGSQALLEPPLLSFMLSILPLFFALSGFLVAGSALRLRNTGAFLLFRVLRIVPALLVEVIISTLILGPLLTSLPLREYFSDPDFFSYFANITGRFRFALPGMFEGLPVDRIVNGNLWTLRPEFHCYLLMSLLMLSRVAYSRVMITILWSVASIAIAFYNQATGELAPGGYFGPTLLVYSFATGVVAFHWRDRIRLNIILAVISGTCAYVLLRVPQNALFSIPALTYLMVWIGAQRLPRISGDYSYGVYLFSYPIQQTLVGTFPSLREWWLLFPAAATIALLIAALSWHFVEMPALRLKKPVLSVSYFWKARFVRHILGSR